MDNVRDKHDDGQEIEAECNNGLNNGTWDLFQSTRTSL